MSNESVIEKLKELDNLYYNTGNSPVSDEEYDILKNEALLLFPDHPYFTTVGAEVPVGKKVKLPFTLGSLNKVKTPKELYSWLKGVKGGIGTQLKMDGVSILVHYKNGELIEAFTRGDGSTGTIITEKAKIFLPNTISYKGELYLRGEVMMEGEKYKELGYKNPRNATAGILNRDDIGEEEHLSVYFYEVVDCDDETVMENIAISLEFIKHKLPELNTIKLLSIINNHSLDDLNNSEIIVKELTKIYSSYVNDYNIDGIVLFELNSQRDDGYYPENKVAFKINKKPVVVLVNDIVWNTTRTGRVVPVLSLEPTDIDGSTVSKVTAFNKKFIENNKITSECKIDLVKSGEIIPHIVNVYPVENAEVKLPSVCPSCKEDLVEDDVELRCVNPHCPAQVYYRVEYFLRTQGVENLTEKTLRKLDCDTIEKAYELDEFEISQLDGFGIRSAEQIVLEIHKSLKTTPDRLLTAFGISGWGLENCHNLLKKYDFDDVWKLTEDDLMSIDGIGKILSHNFVYYIGSFRYLYEYLKHIGLEWKTKSVSLKGKTFTLTGSAEIKRDILIQMIENNGGYVKGMSKKVDFLVTNDVKSTSSKAKKARSYNIPIITYDQLLEMM